MPDSIKTLLLKKTDLLGLIFWSLIIMTFLGFLIIGANQDSETNKVNLSSSISDISTQINLPDQYSQPLLISAFSHLLSITPINAQTTTVAQTEGQTIKYLEAYKNTDIVQTKSTHKLKEDIILKKPGHPGSFSYQIDIQSYDVVKDDQGNYLFYPKGQKDNELAKIFTIPAPYMIDAQGRKSESSDVKTELTNQGIFSIEPNKDWLKNATYPIIIDPTIEINILNVHSSPNQGENWEVYFTTKGTSDLKIIPNDQATIDDDEFVSLWCGDEPRTPQILPGDIIYYPDWTCHNQIAKVIHYTKQAGHHTLRFELGGEVAWAYNAADDVSVVLKPDTLFKRNVILRGIPFPLNISETFDGSSLCADGFTSNCDNAWTVSSTRYNGGYSYETIFNSPEYLQGTNALRILDYDSGTCQVSKSFPASDNTYVFTLFKKGSCSRNDSSYRYMIYIKSSDNATQLCSAGGYFATCQPKWHLAHSGSSQTSDTTIALNTKYWLWLEYNKSTGSGSSCKLYWSTNSTKPDSPQLSITDGSETKKAGYLYFEHYYYGLGSSSWGTTFFDHILIKDQVIGSAP